jgi:hypothetical protein
MHRQSVYASAAGLILGLATGCALPKVALGASVSLGRAGGQDGPSRTRLRSALWIAMVYVPGRPDQPEPDRVLERELEIEPPQSSDTPCEFELACAFEQAAIETERERELPP